MKITFGMLRKGECFRFERNVFMKIAEGVRDADGSINAIVIAVSSPGDPERFGNTTEIELFKGAICERSQKLEVLKEF